MPEICTHPLELLKLKDEVWAQTGYGKGDVPCTSCMEEAVGRKLTPDDIDMSFPWWEVDRPIYYAGVQEGIVSQAPTSTDKQYMAGYNIGKRIAGNA